MKRVALMLGLMVSLFSPVFAGVVLHLGGTAIVIIVAICAVVAVISMFKK